MSDDVTMPAAVAERVYRAIIALPANLTQELCEATEDFYRFVRTRTPVPDAPAGDALAAARQNLVRNVTAYVPGGIMEDVSRWLDAMILAARAEGAAEEREAIRKLCDCHVAIANGCPCVESLDAAIRARSPSSGTEARP